jgi:hypothetical protein
VKECPIIFSAPMVRAILEGRKTQTQTRRVVKPHPQVTEQRLRELGAWAEGFTLSEQVNAAFQSGCIDAKCPYGQPGDRLVVRETWQYADWTEDGMPWIRYRADQATRLIEDTPEDWSERLTDAWASLSVPENYALDNRAADRRWRPAIYMPRWASRILLEVTGVRVERLRDISAEDARAEGVIPFVADHLPAAWTGSFERLWKSINGPGSWDANPWLWVVEFRKVSQ